MTLFLYDTATKAVLREIGHVASYTDNRVVTEDGTIYAPLADHVELSSLSDCSEALRAAWREANPSQETRIEELEALVAELLFGGEGV